MDSNPSQPPAASTLVVAGLHKEAQQANGNPKYLGVTNEEGAHPQLSSGMSGCTHIKPIYLASILIHFESASTRDASADSIAEADPGNSVPNDFADLMDLDSPEDDPIIVVVKSEEDEEEDKYEEIHATSNIETKDTSTPKAPSLRQAEAEVKLLSAKPSFPDVVQLNELLDFEEESSDSEYADTIHLTGSRVESLRKKKLKKFDFVTKDMDYVYLTKEQIKEQKRIKESAKAKAAKHEVKVRKKELVDLFGPDVVSSTVKKMLKRRASSKITNYNVLTRKELGIDVDIPLSEQDPLDKLNDLVKKKRKNADDIHDYFRANKRLKLLIQYADHPTETVLNEPVLEIFFRLQQDPELDDHAMTFSSFLLAKVNKGNLNPLKQIRTIEKLMQ
nr:hypothetical protein [Tanacetum cinerariifolium]